VSARYGYLFEALYPFEGKRVLVLNAGAGAEEAARIALEGARVVAADRAVSGLRAAARRALERERRVALVLTGVEGLPFRDGVFDACACLGALERVRDVPFLVREAARVLRPGGGFFYETVNRTPRARALGRLVDGDAARGGPILDPALHVRPEEVERALRGASLRPLDIRGLGPRGSLARVLLDRLRGRETPLAARHDLSFRFMGHAVKEETIGPPDPARTPSHRP